MLVKVIPHGNLSQKILIQAPVVDVGANVKATDIILIFQHIRIVLEHAVQHAHEHKESHDTART